MSRAFKINMPDLRIGNMFLNDIYKLSSRGKQTDDSWNEAIGADGL